MFGPDNTAFIVLYTAIALIFLLNCGLEETARGGRPGLMVLGVALFWPILLAAVIIQLTASYLWSRLHHPGPPQAGPTTTLRPY